MMNVLVCREQQRLSGEPDEGLIGHGRAKPIEPAVDD